MVTFAISNVHIMFMSSYNGTRSFIHYYTLTNDAYITIESYGDGHDRFAITGPVVKHDWKEKSEVSIGITEVHVLYLSRTSAGTFANHFILKNNPHILDRTNYYIDPLLSIEGVVLKCSCKLWDPTSDDDYPIPVTNLLLETADD